MKFVLVLLSITIGSATCIAQAPETLSVFDQEYKFGSRAALLEMGFVPDSIVSVTDPSIKLFNGRYYSKQIGDTSVEFMFNSTLNILSGKSIKLKISKIDTIRLFDFLQSMGFVKKSIQDIPSWMGTKYELTDQVTKERYSCFIGSKTISFQFLYKEGWSDPADIPPPVTVEPRNNN